MEPSTLPIWAQGASIIAIALVSAIVGVLRYLKKEGKEEVTTLPNGSASVISASFIDSKALRELTDAILEAKDSREKESKKSHKDSQELRESMNELNESVILQTDTMTNLVRIVNRDANRNRLVMEDKDA